MRTTKETVVNSVLGHQLQHDRKKNDKETLSESYAEELDENTRIASVKKKRNWPAIFHKTCRGSCHE